MSNAKDTLNRVLDVLGLGKADATIEVEMAQKKTMDGEVILDSENFAIGEPVFIVTEEGNIPVPMLDLSNGINEQPFFLNTSLVKPK